MRKQCIFSGILLCMVAITAKSQIVLKTEYIGNSSYWLDKGDHPRERIGNARGSAIVSRLTASIPVSIRINKDNRPVIWGVGLGGTYASLHNKYFPDDTMVSEIVNLELGIFHLRPLSEKWSLMASLGGGIYTPSAKLSDIRYRNMLGSGGIIFIRHLKPNLDIGGGLALNNAFGYPMVFPAIYFNWSHTGKFSFFTSLTNGLEIAAGYHINDFWKISLVGEMNGQMALLEKDGKEMVFTHQYIIAGFRSEIKLTDYLLVPVTVGVNAYRPASFNERKLKALFSSGNDYYFQVSSYFSAGLKIVF